MKFLLTALLCIMSVTLISYTSALTTTKTEIVKHTDSNPEKEGFWARKESWKSRWVKYWRPKTIYVPVWKKVWTPIIQNEWVPLPNSPVGWSKHDKSSVSEIVY